MTLFVTGPRCNCSNFGLNVHLGRLRSSAMQFCCAAVDHAATCCALFAVCAIAAECGPNRKATLVHQVASRQDGGRDPSAHAKAAPARQNHRVRSHDGALARGRAPAERCSRILTGCAAFGPFVPGATRAAAMPVLHRFYFRESDSGMKRASIAVAEHHVPLVAVWAERGLHQVSSDVGV